MEGPWRVAPLPEPPVVCGFQIRTQMTDKTLHELPPACLKLSPDTALPTKPLPTPAAASLPLFTSSPWWLHGPPPLLATPHLHRAPFALLGCLIPKGSKLTSSRQSSLISPSPLLPQHLYQSKGTASLLLSRPPGLETPSRSSLCPQRPAPHWSHHKHPRMLGECARSPISD